MILYIKFYNDTNGNTILIKKLLKRNFFTKTSNLKKHGFYLIFYQFSYVKRSFLKQINKTFNIFSYLFLDKIKYFLKLNFFLIKFLFTKYIFFIII